MSTLEITKARVEIGKKILDELRKPLQDAAQSAITMPWLRQLDTITSSPPKLIVGIVGATGSGKSSVTNALLGEKQLIPTNCMRACTAVVTEISYNDQEGSDYRAIIEFVSKAEWQKELELLLSDVESATGSIQDTESEAGIAFSKIKAVYPYITAQNLATVDVAQLMAVQKVAERLGCNLEFQEDSALALYNTMKSFVGSKEKTSGVQDRTDTAEFWPMIRRVRIYTKAEVLATGCVLVDLPGVADSNAARAAVAKKYLQNCSALWVVAPIIRAVDDKSARHLLGEGFKRQLQRDGTLGRITFICSKTDEIVLSEVRSVLTQDAEFVKKIAPIDKAKADLDKDRTALLDAISTAKVGIDSLDVKNREAATKETAYRELRKMAAKGTIVYPPVFKQAAQISPSKRQRVDDDMPPQTPKKSRTQQYLSQTYQSPLKRLASTPAPTPSPTDSLQTRAVQPTYEQDTSMAPLTPAEVVKQLQELKDLRSKIRDEKKDLRTKKHEHTQELAELKEIDKEIREQEWVACVLARNNYSSGYIREDFVDGVRDLSRDEAEDDEYFDPEAEIQPAEELRQALPVFCISSQGYQKLIGNMEEEQISACFSSEEDTGIPALRNHAYKIGEAEMIATGEAHIDKVKSLLTSLELWSSGSDAAIMTNEEADQQSRKHQEVVDDLTKALLDITKDTLNAIENEISTKILDTLSQAAKAGIEKAVLTAEKWGASRKSEEPGLAWGTYRATVRREGCFTNTAKEHNFNEDLSKPFMHKIDPRWNQVFNKTIYKILNNGIAQCKTKIDIFEATFTDIMTTRGTSSTVKAIFDEQLVRFVKVLDAALQDVKKNIKAEQKTANRLCEETIQSEMTDVYQACQNERGTGCFVRMKTKMKTHLEGHSEEMFKEAQSDMQSTLKKMMKNIKKDTLRELTTSCDSFNKDCGYLISRKGREFAGLDEGVQNTIFEVLEKAKAAFNTATCSTSDHSDQREQSLPLRSATPAAAASAITAEPNQTFTATDWGEEPELQNGSEYESDSPSELSDIQP